MKQLICEGACNKPGTIKDYDAAVLAAIKTRVGNALGLAQRWIDFARTFRYTAHVETLRLDHMACATCGHVRRYGRAEF